jgi:hypothetical protein
VRNRRLHDALAAFAEEAAWQLAEETSAGAEVPFEVIDAAGGRRHDTPLYCYRPLTAEFIDDRLGLLGRLPSFLPALHAMGEAGGLETYLELRGERPPPPGRDRAAAALRAFLSRVFEESTDFVLSPERLRHAYGELEATLYEVRSETEVIVPVLGLRLESAEMLLGEGVSLVRGDTLEGAPADAVWGPEGEEPHVLAVLRWEAAAGDEAPLRHARVRLGRLLTALRLYDEVAICFGAAAWTRTGGGPWHAVVLGVGSGRSHGTCLVPAAQEDELRAFCSLVGRRMPKAGEIAWALRRHELGCERDGALEALTDHLLALRALLEPEGPQSGRLAGRLAALCATPDERIALTERVARAIALEHAHVVGLALPEPQPAALVRELAAHLRALLRDVLCGHLDPDLRGAADAILASGSSESPTLA